MKIRGMTVFLIVVVVVLLVVAVIANISTFKQLGWIGGKSKPKPSGPVAKEPNSNDPTVKNATPPAPKEENKKNSGNSNERAALEALLSSGQYGRSNPFLPLRGARPKSEPGPKPVPPDAPGPLMQVTAILGDQAIIEVDGASKTVSAGESLAGMEVVSIGESEVLLRKEDKDYTLTLGEEPKHVPPGEAE